MSPSRLALHSGHTAAGAARAWRLHDHAGAEGFVGNRVDQDKAPGAPALTIWIEEQRALHFHAHHSNFVEMQLARRLMIERVDIHPVADLAHARLRHLS